MYLKYRPDKLFFWNRPRRSFWAAPGRRRARLSWEGRLGAASSLPARPSRHGGLRALPGDTEAVPQVQEAMSLLPRLQARSGTKHPRICSPLATAALSHRELRYQHRPETDPPTAAGSQAGKALWGPALRAGDPPRTLPAWASPESLDESELQALCCLPGAPTPLGAQVGGAPCPALRCLLCPPPCPAVPGSARSMGRGAAAVSPPPASPLPGSRVSSRARLCRPLAPGSCFLLQLPAAFAAPQPGSQLSATACPKPT